MQIPGVLSTAQEIFSVAYVQRLCPRPCRGCKRVVPRPADGPAMLMPHHGRRSPFGPSARPFARGGSRAGRGGMACGVPAGDARRGQWPGHARRDDAAGSGNHAPCAGVLAATGIGKGSITVRSRLCASALPPDAPRGVTRQAATAPHTRTWALMGRGIVRSLNGPPGDGYCISLFISIFVWLPDIVSCT